MSTNTAHEVETVKACTDCLVASEYGHRPVADDEDASTSSGYNADAEKLWWVGEGDRVTDVEPLNRLDGYHITAVCDEDCESFSSSPCQGCGSTLGGDRHHLAIWEA